MKRQILFGLGLCMLMAFTGCKSSKESTYKAAYEQAKAQQAEQGLSQSGDPVEITPIVSTTTTTVTPVVSNEAARSEKVVLASGAPGSLKAYSVVCGSFQSKTNAEGLKDKLAGDGYSAIVVQNPATGMYRVVCASYDDKAQAAQAKERFKANYPSNAEFQRAWLLYNN